MAVQAVRLDPKSPVPLYHQIAEEIRARIERGELGAGDGLAPLREAAEAWGVNMHTVRRAYTELARQGLVESRRAVGTLVTAATRKPRRRTDRVGGVPKGSRRRVTVSDIAKAAGVSPMTVSRVLNGNKSVAPATADRVRAAVAESGFRPNSTARNLRHGRTFTTIGLVVDDIANPYWFYSTVNGAVEEVAREHDAMLVLSSFGGEPSRERNVVETLMARGIDGLLLHPALSDHRYLEQLGVQSRPVVFLGRPARGIDGDTILVDNVGGARQAVEHLIARGHQRIGVIVPGTRSSIAGLVLDDPHHNARAGRLAGFYRALALHGLPDDPALVRFAGTSADTAARATCELLALPDPPTALFAVNSRMTVGALHALGSGLGGVALVGFDDFDLSDVFDPPITVVTQDPSEMGRQAAQLLFTRLAGERGPVKTITLPVRLIERGSGELTPNPRC